MIISKKLNNELNHNKKLSVKKLLLLLGDKSFFYFLFIITFFSSIPAPSWGLGSSTIPGGILCFIISLQILLGFKHVYLPNFIEKKKIKTKYIKKINSFFYKFKFKKLNDSFVFENSFIEKISAFFILMNSILMMIPIIFTNWAPSFCVTSISLSHILKNKWFLTLSLTLNIFMLIGYVYFFKYIIYYINILLNKIDLKFKKNII